MRRRSEFRTLALSVGVALIGAAPAPARADGPPSSGLDSGAATPMSASEYIVLLRKPGTERNVRQAFAGLKIAQVKRLTSKSYLVRFAEPVDPPEAEARARKSPIIKAVQPNQRYKTSR